MDTALEAIAASETQIEQILETFELSGRLSEALAEYTKIESKLTNLDILPVGHLHNERARVQSACLEREVEILHLFGRLREASVLAERQLSTARLSGDLITLAYALLSAGQTRMMNKDFENGEHALAESIRLLSSGESDEHNLGLARYWLVEAELCKQGLLPGGEKQVQKAAAEAVKLLTPLIDRWPLAQIYLKQARSLIV